MVDEAFMKTRHEHTARRAVRWAVAEALKGHWKDEVIAAIGQRWNPDVVPAMEDELSKIVAWLQVEIPPAAACVHCNDPFDAADHEADPPIHTPSGLWHTSCYCQVRAASDAAQSPPVHAGPTSGAAFTFAIIYQCGGAAGPDSDWCLATRTIFATEAQALLRIAEIIEQRKTMRGKPLFDSSTLLEVVAGDFGNVLHASHRSSNLIAVTGVRERSPYAFGRELLTTELFTNDGDAWAWLEEHLFATRPRVIWGQWMGLRMPKTPGPVKDGT